MAERIIEDAVVRVKPSFVGFRSALEAGVKRESKGVNATVGVKIDQQQLRTQINTVTRELNKKKVTLRIDLGMNKAEATMQRFFTRWNGKTIKMRVDIEGLAGLETRLRALQELRDRAGGTDRDALRARDQQLRERALAIREGELEARRQRDQDRRDRDRDRSARRGSDSQLTAIAIAPERLLTMPEVISAISPASIAAAGAIAGIASQLGIATIAAGTFGIAAVGVFADLKQAYQESPFTAKGVFQPAVDSLNELRATYRDVQTVTREPILGLFTQGITLANSLLPRFIPLITATTGALGGVLDQFSKFTATTQFSNFLGFLESRTPGVLNTLGSMFISLNRIVIGFIETFDDLGQSTLGGLDDMLVGLANALENMRESQGFQEFSDAVVKYGPEIVHTLGDVIVAIYNIGKAIAPIGMVFIKTLDYIARFLGMLNPTVVLTFVAALVTMRTVMLGLTLFGRLAASITAYQTALTAARAATTAYTTATSVAVVATNALRVAIAGTGIGALLVVIGTVIGALISYASTSEDAATATDKFKDSVAGLSDQLLASKGAFDQGIRETIAKAIMGAPGVLDLVKEFKLPPGALVDSILGDKTAWGAVVTEADRRVKETADKAAAALAQYNAEFDKLSPKQKQLEGQGLGPQAVQDARALYDAAKKNADYEAQRAATVKGILPTIQGEVDEYRTLNGLIGEAKNGTEGIADAAVHAQNAWEDFQKAMAETPQESLLKAATTAVENWQDAVDGVTEANARLREVNAQVAEDAATSAKKIVTANNAVKEAIDRHRQALAGVRKAEDDLEKAREEARRRLRDQPDTEEALKIAVARAELQELQTRGLSAASLTRRQALLDLKNAREELQDFGANKITKIGQDEGVKNAEETLQKAKEGVTKAEQDLEEAHKRVDEAYKEQTKTIERGAKARQDAETAVRNANDKLSAQEIQLYKTATAMGISVGQLKNLKTEADKLEGQYKINIELNKGDVDKNLQTTQEYLEAIRLLADPANAGKSASDILAMAKANITAANKVTEPSAAARKAALRKQYQIDNIPRSQWPPELRATGGAIYGRGTGRSDSIPAMLSQGEHVWTAREVQAAGGQKAVERIRKSILHRAAGGSINLDRMLDEEGILARAIATYNSLVGTRGAGAGAPTTPGATAPIPVARTGEIADMQKWANQQKGKVYNFGSVGPNVYDCSGLVGDLWAMATGKPLYKRYFTTYDMPLNGWKRGPGALTMYLGPGHTAANIGGLHAEAYGGNGVPLAIGHVGTPLSYYTSQWHMPGLAAGGFLDLKRSRKLREEMNKRVGWPEVTADNGAILPPRSRTLVHNGTNKPESVGFPGGEVELSTRSIYRLAQAMNALGISVEMDDEVVAKRSEKALSDSLRSI